MGIQQSSIGPLGFHANDDEWKINAFTLSLSFAFPVSTKDLAKSSP